MVAAPGPLVASRPFGPASRPAQMRRAAGATGRTVPLGHSFARLASAPDRFPIQRIRQKDSPPQDDFVDKQKKGNLAGLVHGQVVSDDLNGGKPTANPVGWQWLVNNVRRVQGAWVQFHLINQWLGGPGDKAWNLVPTRVQTNNRSDWRRFEKAAKDSVRIDGDPVFCTVEAFYPGLQPDGFPSRIEATAEYWDDNDHLWYDLDDVGFNLTQPQRGAGGQLSLYAGELTATQWKLGVGMPEAVAKVVAQLAGSAGDVDDLIGRLEDHAQQRDRRSQDWSLQTQQQVEYNIRSAAGERRRTNMKISF